MRTSGRAGCRLATVMHTTRVMKKPEALSRAFLLLYSPISRQYQDGLSQRYRSVRCKLHRYQPVVAIGRNFCSLIVALVSPDSQCAMVQNVAKCCANAMLCTFLQR